jgi:spermidine/putrescine transport system substrate-binding protein
MCWEGYESPHIKVPFEQRHQIKIDAKTLLSDQLAAASLISDKNLDIDVININNAFVKDSLNLHGLIKTLNKDRFENYVQSIHPTYSSLLPWSFNHNDELIGIGQRFGPFNLVVNTHSISVSVARDQGFNLANDPAYSKRFGFLDYPDFNIFHICIGAELNPFSELDQTQIEAFDRTANDWCQRAQMITSDHHVLNAALISGEIDFYISGGIYTASPARLAGYDNITAIVPEQGPINGKGGIVFSEITSVIDRIDGSQQAESFLAYLLEPETAVRTAFTKGTCNPIAQMGDPRVFNAFSKAQLKAIQWDDLETDLDRCSHYQIPPNNLQLLGLLSEAKRRVSLGAQR